jgi:abhydrolase domain-containing protein 8
MLVKYGVKYELCCRAYGAFVFVPQKPLLYFLHGVGCSADLWSALLQHFTAAGYEVVAPDMLGHGYSAAPDNASAYTFHHLLKDSIDIFDRFVGEHRKCVVIGHAYG